MDRSFEIAHVNIEDVKLVIVFLDEAMDLTAYEALGLATAKAGLEGEVVAVWPDEYGRTRFFARRERQAFFRIADYDQLRAQINGTLRCSLA
jgi:hypothetical protein